MSELAEPGYDFSTMVGVIIRISPLTCKAARSRASWPMWFEERDETRSSIEILMRIRRREEECFKFQQKFKSRCQEQTKIWDPSWDMSARNKRLYLGHVIWLCPSCGPED